MNLLILDISYKIKIIQHLVLLWLASVKWKHDFMGHPCQSMFSGMSCPSYVYSPCFPRHLLSRDICLCLRLYNTKDIYCLFHIHFLRNSITFLHVSLLHCNAGYHTVCTATVTQGFIHSRALTNVQWSLVFVMSALQHHRIQEPPKRFIALRSSLCIALSIWSFSGAEMPDGISQVEHLWHEKKNDKHSQDDPWDCLCSTMLISAVVTHHHNWQLEQLWAGERGLATQPETKQLGLHYPQGMCEQICWSGEFLSSASAGLLYSRASIGKLEAEWVLSCQPSPWSWCGEPFAIGNVEIFSRDLGGSCCKNDFWALGTIYLGHCFSALREPDLKDGVFQQ